MPCLRFANVAYVCLLLNSKDATLDFTSSQVKISIVYMFQSKILALDPPFREISET